MSQQLIWGSDSRIARGWSWGFLHPQGEGKDGSGDPWKSGECHPNTHKTVIMWLNLEPNKVTSCPRQGQNQKQVFLLGFWLHPPQMGDQDSFHLRRV